MLAEPQVILPVPGDLGLPRAPFPDWRAGQPEAILHAIDSERRFRGLVLPTGSGKSLIYMAIAKLTGWRTVVLTSTKALQRQLMRDFEADSGIRLVQGQREYECVAVKAGGELEGVYGPAGGGTVRVDHGPCHGGTDCTLKANGCTYFDAVRAGVESQVLITNYAWWLTLKSHPFVSITPELIVCDEAHAAPDALASTIGARIYLPDTDLFLSYRASSLAEHSTDVEEWKLWASKAAGELRRRLEHWRSASSDGARRHRRMANLLIELSKLSNMDPDVTVFTRDEGRMTVQFDPIWAAPFAEDYLFRGAEHVVLTSATMTRHTADLLGVVKRDLDLYESGDGFDATRRPVYICPAKSFVFLEPIRVDHRLTRDDEKAWVRHIDAIIASRSDRKGIIHTVSYRRRDSILALSKHKTQMMTHDRTDAVAQIARFKRAPAGTVLVSPAVSTGYDFPYAECEYQIIAKIPFPDSRDPITKARTVVDKQYPAHLAMQELVQSVGRGMRAPGDQCETFVVDAHAYWFLGRKYKDLAPGWFRQAVQHADAIPTPPPRLDRTAQAE